jgi:tetraacyldisaccharide 4'-kinase
MPFSTLPLPCLSRKGLSFCENAQNPLVPFTSLSLSLPLSCLCRIRSLCLTPLTLIYKSLSNLNRTLTKSQPLPKPVISLGNLTWGGSGKTPLVIELAKFILSQNKKPAILTRGYGRKSSEALIVNNTSTPKTCGDEPLLISKSVPNAAIIVGANRYANALKFESEVRPDIYILDDGFQHWKIQRDLDIVCINAANPFGNNLLIPAGILREPLCALKRAGLLIITNADMIPAANLAQLKKQILNITGKTPLTVSYGDYEIKKLNLTDDFDPTALSKNPVYALSGIGFAQGFLSSVKKAGIEIKDSFIMRDHQEYTPERLKQIFGQIPANGILITTAKDAVKLNDYCHDNDKEEGIEGSCAFSQDDRRDGDKQAEGMKQRIAVLTVRPKFSQEDFQIWQSQILKVLASS